MTAHLLVDQETSAMSELEIDALFFDVLGTLVDEPTGLCAGIRELDPPLDEPDTMATLARPVGDPPPA
ncbi:hypothetical protein ABZ154_25790 [Streptomyces sp. NPDC006261]|uniref:hypothetical protein n=1 Tax=Streptomyces sp. NPDC006261 TaxID=3156739 RepID=UPI0033AD9397